ncbi:hypothetical protein SDC9_96466 [bioreactor metagenome]|uniref:Uncharacterized protein n=1 Tax=bioreactor metagenome TaxID=1076179 RepID=A0A645A959_9ZZZZ
MYKIKRVIELDNIKFLRKMVSELDIKLASPEEIKIVTNISKRAFDTDVMVVPMGRRAARL